MSALPLRLRLCAPLVAGTLVFASPLDAAQPQWTGERFVYETNGSNVAETLNVFAAGEHMPVRLDGHVAGVVSGRFAMAPQSFLDTLGKAYGFVWYYDGAVLQVSPASAETAISIRPNYLSPNDLRVALDRAGVTDPHFPLVVDNAARTVSVLGPATYTARIRAAAERFERDAMRRVRTTVRVFRLSIAHAADKTRVIDGRTVVIPGAATLLRQRFNESVVVDSVDHAGTQAPQAIEFDAPLPTIEADAETNSILIRDKPERIDGDGVVVSDLDVLPQLVSVQAWVVDVDVDALATLQPALSPALAMAAAGGVQPGSGVAADGGRALIADIQALAKSGRARIEVSQTALTLDRSPAVIDRHEASLAKSIGDDDEARDDAAPDVWLSVEPTVEPIAPAQLIGLRVELGSAGDDARHRTVNESVPPDECLVIAAPASTSRQRLVLLIPRIAA
jgi:type III secretion system YscC/HrcC family outer membrane pore protein